MDESLAGGVSRAALPGISGTACIMLVSKVSFLTERASLRSLAGPVEGQQPTARNRFPTTYRRGSKKTSRPQAGRCGDSIRESRCIRLVTEAGCGGHGGRLASKAVRKYLAVRPVEASPPKARSCSNLSRRHRATRQVRRACQPYVGAREGTQEGDGGKERSLGPPPSGRPARWNLKRNCRCPPECRPSDTTQEGFCIGSRPAE